MNFKQGDKVKIISKGSYYVGATGTVVSEGVDGAYRVQIEQPAPKYSGFDTMGIISGFFESEIELVDSEREALIELAETLDKARKQANASGNYVIESQRGVYGQIALSLHDTLEEIVGAGKDAIFNASADRVYDSILDGNTVREALAAVKG